MSAPRSSLLQRPRAPDPVHKSHTSSNALGFPAAAQWLFERLCQTRRGHPPQPPAAHTKVLSWDPMSLWELLADPAGVPHGALGGLSGYPLHNPSPPCPCLECPPPPKDPSARGHTGTATSPSHQRLGGVRGSSAVWTAVRPDNQRGVPSRAGEVRAHWPWVTTFGASRDPTQPNNPPFWALRWGNYVDLGGWFVLPVPPSCLCVAEACPEALWPPDVMRIGSRTDLGDKMIPQ